MFLVNFLEISFLFSAYKEMLVLSHTQMKFAQSKKLDKK